MENVFFWPQIPCVWCLSAAVAHGWSWDFPLVFILPLFVIWWPSRLLCNMSLSFLSFPKSLPKSFFFHPWLLNGKACLVLCVCIHVNHWTWVDLQYDFSFVELVLWYFLFGFKHCSLCFLVFAIGLWCWSVFPKSLSNCIHQRRCSTSVGVSWNAGLGLAFGFGWEQGGWAS